MTFHYRKTPMILFLSMIIFLWIAPSWAADGPKKVAILPFKVNAAGDLSYLQEGIVDMLASRLAWKGEVEILEKGLVGKKVDEIGGPVNKEKAVVIGRSLGADYVILGSLTVFGESVSIDARILDVNKGEEMVTAFNQSKGMDEVIPTINQFALDINEKIMGRVIQPRIAAGPAEEKKGLGGLLGSETTIEEGKTGYVQRFHAQINGLDMGDVDGDGKKEMVFVDINTVYIYKWDGQSFRSFKQIKGRWATNYVFVSLGDMNRNGREEIYVSNPANESISSFVLEWDGSAFRELAKNQPWFFRVLEIPGQGQKLLGQKREVRAGFQEDIFVLRPEKNGYAPAEKLRLPSSANIFGFALFEPEGKGAIYSVVLRPLDYLGLFDPNQAQIWMSEDHFGGTYTYVDIDTGLVGSGQYADKRLYFSSPVDITDIDENGEPEVMVCKNSSGTGRLMSRVAIYSSGEVYFLTYNGAGLAMKWKTKKQSGPVVGYKVTDFDGDGIKELVMASILSQDTILGSPRSQVVIYDLK